MSDLIQSADQRMLLEDELSAVSGGIKEVGEAGHVVAYRSLLETMADDSCNLGGSLQLTSTMLQAR
jgi:hypothetical protein